MGEFKRLLYYTKGRRVLFAVAIIGVGINSFISTYFVALLLQNVTSAIMVKTAQAVATSVIVLIPLFLFSLFIKFFSDYLIGKTCSYAAMRMRKDIVSRILASKLGSLNGKNSGDIISAFTSDMPTAFDNLADVVSAPVSALFLGVGGLAYILTVDKLLALLTVGTGIFILIYSLLFARWMRRVSGAVLSWRGMAAGHIKELLDGFTTIHMYRIQKICTERYRTVVDNVKRNSIIYGAVSGFLGGVNNGVDSVFGMAVIFAAGLMVFSGKYNVPVMLKIAQMAGGVAGVFNISRILTDTQAALNGSRRVFRFIDDIEPEKSGRETARISAAEDTSELIAFSGVSFGYADTEILTDVSFTVQKNRITVFVGESGSGKSTILRLLQALYRPVKGNIAVAGIDVSNWNIRNLRTQMAYVPQEPLLFEGTIKENIWVGSDHRGIERAVYSAKLAGIDEFIDSLPEKYDTWVEEGGMSLSGGQKQRIALARAFYRDAPILILDEVTSSIDDKNEKIIYNSLMEYKKDHTVILSTHKESAYNIADRIFNVESGKVTYFFDSK